jgi:hypothetical protein
VTAPELTRLCRLWQRRLRLMDWRVTVAIVPAADLNGSYGDGNLDGYEMTAAIRIADNAPVESTLIHELLHLRLLPWGVDDTDERQTAMNLLADSFLQAYPRRKRDVSLLQQECP